MAPNHQSIENAPWTRRCRRQHGVKSITTRMKGWTRPPGGSGLSEGCRHPDGIHHRHPASPLDKGQTGSEVGVEHHGPDHTGIVGLILNHLEIRSETIPKGAARTISDPAQRRASRDGPPRSEMDQRWIWELTQSVASTMPTQPPDLGGEWATPSTEHTDVLFTRKVCAGLAAMKWSSQT